MKKQNRNRNGSKRIHPFIVWIGCSILFPVVLFAQDTEWTIQDVPFSNGELNGIHFIDQSTGWAVGLNMDNGENVLLRTSDGGDNWGYQAIDFTAKKIFFTDANIGYAIRSGGGAFDIRKSTDGGDTWNSTNYPALTGVVLEDIYFRAENDGWVVGKYKSGQDQTSLLLHTTDGQNWSLPNYLSEVGSLYSIHFEDENNGWAVGNLWNTFDQPLILYTTDGGSNWIKQTTPSVSGKLYSVFFVDQDNGWTCGGAGFSSSDNIILFNTTDGGDTWSDLSPTLPTTGHGMHFTSVTEGYLSIRNNDGSDWNAKLYKTDDGGATWTEALSPIPGMYSNDIIFVKGSLKIWSAGSKSPNEPTIGFTSYGSGQVLSSIVVSPQNPSLTFGEQMQFYGDGYDDNGNPMDPPITPMWSTDGGNITQEGLYTAPYTEGEYTVTAENEEKTIAGETKVRVTPGMGGVVTSVAPTSLAGTTSPASFTGPIGFQIEVKAEPSTGWAFMHWVNANPADQKTAMAILASPPTEATAHFAPILTLSPGPSNPGYTTACPAVDENDNTNTPVIQIRLTASPADNWEASAVGFQVEGNLESKHVRRAKLHLGDEFGPVLATANYGSHFSFPVPSPYNKISSNSSIVLMVTFDFEEKETSEGGETVQFTIFANRTFVGATAEQYPPGVILPIVPPTQTVLSGPIYLGCVHNINTRLVYSSIQSGIDDNATQDNHTIKVCPGTYDENVKVAKSLIINAIDGCNLTVVRAIDPQNHVFILNAANIEIKGFLIKNVTAAGKAGILINGTGNTGCIISDNKIEKNNIGIVVQNSPNNTISDNIVIQNDESGIIVEGSEAKNNKIENNYIGTDDSGSWEIGNKNGICIRDQANNNMIGGLTEDKSNTISGNSLNGVLIEGNGTSNNKIWTNYVGTNKGSTKRIPNGDIDYHNGAGIFISNGAKTNTIKWNVISGNNYSGLTIYGSGTNQNEVRENKIGTNKDASEDIYNMYYGVCIHGGAKLNIIQGNIISGNRDNGLNLYGEGTENNQIVENKIGTNVDGTQKIPNGGLDHGNGIWISNGAKTNIIQNNLISGNYNDGIYIQNSGTDNNKILDNMIGTNYDGTKSLPNGNRKYADVCGIKIFSGPQTNLIQGNLISGNTKNGVVIQSIGTDNNIIINNKIGTNIDGTMAIPNGDGIVDGNGINVLHGAKDNIIDSNLISGNSLAGISLQYSGTDKNIITNNKIGTNYNGDDKIPNKFGIVIVDEAELNIVQGNLISGNIGGLGIISSNNKIISNKIGTDLHGLKALGNIQGIAIEAGAQSNIVQGNLISSNNIGIILQGKGNEKNIILANKIGTDINVSADMLPNQYGIFISYDSKRNIVSNNIFAGSSKAAISIIGKSTKYNSIKSNFIGLNRIRTIKLPNHYGIILMEECSANLISNNYIWYNAKAIYSEGHNNFVYHNDIRFNTQNTGIHLNNSTADIVGNIITSDQGDAIVCENGSNLVITKNRISNNNGFGLLNLDSTITINATGNWWGDANGPGGVGPGSGDEVSVGVDYSGWKQTPVALVACASIDTLFIPQGQTDSTHCSFQNWENYDDALNVVVNDSLGWLWETGEFTLSMKDSLGADTTLHISVPANTPFGTTNKVTMTAESQNNSNWTDADSFWVVVYNPAMVRLVVVPDSATLSPGDSLQFTAHGVDIVGNAKSVDVNWTATGGTIDSTGLFTAGDTEGSFQVTATDQSEQMEGIATVIITSETGVTDGRSEMIPEEFALHQNYPNPFNPETTIRYDVKEPCRVVLKIFNLRGQEVATLVDAQTQAGSYSVRFDANGLASGIYFYKIEMEDPSTGSPSKTTGQAGQRFMDVGKMVLIE